MKFEEMRSQSPIALYYTFVAIQSYSNIKHNSPFLEFYAFNRIILIETENWQRALDLGNRFHCYAAESFNLQTKNGFQHEARRIFLRYNLFKDLFLSLQKSSR